MKNIVEVLSLSLLIGIGSAVQAQTTAKTTTPNLVQMKVDGRSHDCVVMQSGKMMMMKGGKTTPMTKDMTMSDGTKCLTNGTCLKKDGTKMAIKEGHCVMMDGKMTTMDKLMKTDKMTGGHKIEKAKS
jgi:hypothetical protein